MEAAQGRLPTYTAQNRKKSSSQFGCVAARHAETHLSSATTLRQQGYGKRVLLRPRRALLLTFDRHLAGYFWRREGNRRENSKQKAEETTLALSRAGVWGLSFSGGWHPERRE